jgi:hypothetical protein
MTDYSQPTHIDFITTFKSKTTWNGYWFLTWIYGPGGFVIWRKTLDNKWELEVGSQHSLDDANIYPGNFTEYNGRVYARGEHKEHLDSILEKHMKEHDCAGEPYEYWKKYLDKVEAARERFRHYTGKFVIANTESQLPNDR